MRRYALAVAFAITPLAAQSPEELQSLFADLRSSQRQANDRADRGFLALGAKAVPHLLRVLREGRDTIYLSPATRRAAHLLEKLAPQAVVCIPDLIEDLQDSEQYYTLALLRLLGRIGPHAPQQHEAIDAAVLSRYLRKRHVWLHKACADASFRLAITPNQPNKELIKLLYSRVDPIRRAAAEQLATRGKRAAVAIPHLERLLLQPTLRAHVPGAPFGRQMTVYNHEPFRQLLALALLRVCTAKHVHLTAHIQLLSHKNPRIRREAALAIGHGGAAAEPAVEELSFAIFDDDKAVSREAITALGLIGPKAVAAVPDLKTILTRGDRGQQARAKVALRQIEPRRTPG